MNEISTPIKIKIPIAAAIGISFLNKLQFSVDRFFRQNNYALVCKSRSNRLDYRWRRNPRDRFEYISSIAHQIGTNGDLPTLLDLGNDPQLGAAYSQLEVISTWHPRNYLHWQLTDLAIDTWLNYLADRRDDILPFTSVAGSSNLAPEIVLYARQRCHSFLNIAHDEGIVPTRSSGGIYLDRAADSTDCQLIFTHTAELDLIATYIDFIDILAGANQKISIERATIDLARSWLEFYRHCRIIGIDRPLATARVALTTHIWHALDRALSNYWGIAAAME